MTTAPATLRRTLSERVNAGHGPFDAAWQAAVRSVPREAFLGTAAFRHTGTAWEPVYREEVGEEEWLRMVYDDRTWVTQVGGRGAADVAGPVAGAPTSSATSPSLVVRTLHTARLRGDERVLEIGTGTGYSTALLCHRLGADNVTSVEYDRSVAGSAAEHLKAAGYAPTLVTGDGLNGHRAGADYDALVATCAVRHVPVSWLLQVRDGGSLTMTLSGWMLAAASIRLTVEEDGSARGRFLACGDAVSYMLARPHERPPRPSFHRHPGVERDTHFPPTLLQDPVAHFVAQLAAPSAELVRLDDDIVLLDVATGSQAWTEPHSTGWTVHQSGPLRLWDQVADALAVWLDAGRPGITAFSMTADPDDQVVSLRGKEAVSWRLPN
ncbi:methyltransferase [Streptomyces griseoflavus]|uniref:ATP-grasp peptide maturase system methyltransferase n=1 Tax=Streptomyces rimosus TaxID=1927 RepID=UPI0004C5BF96|nr:ATP-grasp peptide maturase system methyltransferase [Streptomyces rimosus]KOG53977.1 methyltransferase [Streptomyces griseoflavus]